jgi:uncharacterized protein
MTTLAVTQEALISSEEVIAATRLWLERAVIGLNLCPFAEHAYRTDRVRFCVSRQRSPADLLQELCGELLHLNGTDPGLCETTLLIHPDALRDFGEYNQFLGVCEAAIADAGLEGDLQVAGFHPEFQFAGTDAEDIENYTNRSPYPMLHLLREASIERAVAAVPDTAAIYERNIRTLRELGHAGWRRLWRD